ncbi:hypothetical protein CVS54_02054 [Microbacterium oxydans]|uniref:DUF427 domain-containing protein n=1 Tax=Microbacterium oxydans TaxID=82380 RepID=A0A3Q9J4B6_9MICO|nr:DUF427 domain-containing protein [Microbacterium oxydans]AZS40715.1 hypothetical protein CVS54_02054 [Microbacterium oxydans]
MHTPRPIAPAAGQESVWDYPRPPRVEAVVERITIRLGGQLIADTVDAVRVLETSHPPVYYLPIADFVPGALVDAAGSSFCEFKGSARYFDVRAGFEILSDRVAVYAGQMDECTVGDEVASPQPGGFYGGWVTSWVVGPFKGVPGSRGW